MLRPYTYSFGSFHSDCQSSPSLTSKDHPSVHPPPMDELAPSAIRVAESQTAMDRFPEVEFDCGHFDYRKSAVFKYVLIELRSSVIRTPKLLVRGMTSAEYHADSAAPTLRQIDSAGLFHKVIGGGRIKYDAKSKSILVYGYSLGFPWPKGIFKNEEVASIVSRNLKEITSVDWSDDGY